ncbi:MAG: hypothetical protein GQ572_03350 [Gammaproteobacteria bacterium]|nr:hypothetical protein [Gammaproteobacteria bacterium]
MRLLLPLLFSILFLLASGCSMNSTKGQEFPEMYNEKPVAILVIPAINHSTAADSPILYSSTINEPLSNAGFYVLPIEVTDRFLRNEGFTDGESLKDIPPQKFAEPFGADAVLYVNIEVWDTNYYIIGGNVTVSTEYQIKSCKTGETLWNYKGEMVVNTGDDGGGGLLAAIIATAVATSMQDYVPIAIKINQAALKTVPYGKYNNMFDKDMNQSIKLSHIEKK